TRAGSGNPLVTQASISSGSATSTFNVRYTDTTAGTFSLSLTDATTGTGYTPLTTGTGSVTVNPAVDNKLVFGVQPSNTVAGVAISPAVTVRILDQFNNLTNSTATVTMAI